MYTLVWFECVWYLIDFSSTKKNSIQMHDRSAMVWCGCIHVHEEKLWVVYSDTVFYLKSKASFFFLSHSFQMFVVLEYNVECVVSYNLFFFVCFLCFSIVNFVFKAAVTR
jgi:hypothetical protein